MNLSLYVPGDTRLHRLRPDVKLACLLVFGIALFFADSLLILAIATLAALIAIWSTGASLAMLRRQLTGIAVIVAIIVVANVWLFDWRQATLVGLRITSLVLLAFAVTLTTRSSEILETLERVLRPLERIGIADAQKVGLAVSLVLRFVPEVLKQISDLREARAARGLRVGPLNLIVPLVVRTLRSADAIAEAIDARAYPPDSKRSSETNHEHP
ncbi:MAG: energy-coupling factor transporter transmembrane component T family protein [Salinarimonas sp.]